MTTTWLIGVRMFYERPTDNTLARAYAQLAHAADRDGERDVTFTPVVEDYIAFTFTIAAIGGR